MSPKDPFNSLPVDETILAALVEGDLGGREADAVRERVLAADPELAATIELMERDRVMLRALGDETPPAGLAESVVARLEREALLGLASGEPASARPPVSMVHAARRRPSGAARWMTSPAGAGLAMAAVLALAVGVTLQVIGPGRGGSPSPRPELIDEAGAAPGPLALDGGGAEPRVAGDRPAPPALTRAADEEPAALASQTPEAERTFDDADRALALLAEGRLLVRVRAAAPEQATAELARLVSRQPRANEAFRLADQVTEPVALAMERRFAPASVEHDPLIYAAGEDQPPGEDRAEVRPAESALESVYMADARTDRAALASLLAALSLGDGKAATFEELPEPLELPRVLTPDAVLWWGRSPGEWSRRAYVPVVVERVERP